jgi:hypothetical protein
MRLLRFLALPLAFAICFAGVHAAPAAAQKTGAPPTTMAVPPEEPPPPYPALRSADAQAVRDAMHAYMDAVYRAEGEAAARMVTRGTREYYARMRDMAVQASEAQVRAAPLVDRLTILMFRHRVPAGELLALTGDSVFAYTVAHGWVSGNAKREPPERVQADVFGEGDHAVMRYLGEELHLVREDGGWRWDMLPLLQAAGAQFAPGPEVRVTEDEYIVQLLEITTGRKVSPRIWQPLP